MSETAYSLFPSDVPTRGFEANPPARLGSGGQRTTPLAADAPNAKTSLQASAISLTGADRADASKLFGSEQMPDPAASVAKTLQPFAESAWFDGDRGRSAELREASETLAEDFRQAGTDPDQISEIMDLTREFQGNLFAGPLPDEMIRQQTERGYEALAEMAVTDADLALARRLIDDMDRATPGLKAYLDATGMGSDLRTVQAAIREARRRYGR